MIASLTDLQPAVFGKTRPLSRINWQKSKCTDPVHWIAAGLSHDKAILFVDGLIAVAEKVSALETEDFFAERLSNVDPDAFRALLFREGGEPPRAGDEII